MAPRSILDLKPGDVFASRFVIEAILADGGFGRVFRARQQPTGIARAVKALFPRFIEHAAARARFETEARVGARIGSPHVVEVSDAGVDPETGSPWLAMELLQGETLEDLVTREGALSRARTAALAAQLGDALGAAHDHGVFHLDLKPENLFLARLGVHAVSQPVLKVLDFGIAKMLSEGRSYTDVTTAMGSPLWMAPEQSLTGSQLRASADVWSLGLLAFWMLTGHHYWRSAQRSDATIHMMLLEIHTAPIEPPSLRAAELGLASTLLPPRFDAWFAHCAHRAPAERFQHARAAVTALLLVLDERSRDATVVLTEPPRPPLFDDPPRPDTLPDTAPTLPDTSRGTVALPADSVAAVLAMLQRSDFAAARGTLDATLHIDASSAELWALRGACSAGLGRFDEAANDYAEAIALAPGVAAHHRGRASAWRSLGNTAQARADEAVAIALEAGAR